MRRRLQLEHSLAARKRHVAIPQERAVEHGRGALDELLPRPWEVVRTARDPHVSLGIEVPVTTSSAQHYARFEDLTEEVVFPLVRRRVPPPSFARVDPGRRIEDRRLDREDAAPPIGISTRRVLVVQTMGLVLFVAAFAFAVLAWLVR